MEITAYEDGSCLNFDQVKALWCAGSVSEPTYVKADYVYRGTSKPGKPSIVRVNLMEGYYYADFDGHISLDIRKVIADLSAFNPDYASSMKGWNIQFYIGDDSAVEPTKSIYVFPVTYVSEASINDIDFLVVPMDARLAFTVFVRKNYIYEYGLIQNGRSLTIGMEEAEDTDRLLYETIDIANLGLSAGMPFCFYVKQISTVDGDPVISYRSTVYQITDGDFQQFAFSDRFGGYTFIPMSGALERSTEYDFENARYQSGYGKVSGSGSPVFTQYTGGLTKKAASALSGLLTSDNIFHQVGNAWYKILVEEADIRLQTTDSLHFGSFSFRYADEDDVPIDDVL